MILSSSFGRLPGTGTYHGKSKLPIRMIAPGRVFRSDEADATHFDMCTTHFVWSSTRNITFADFKGTLSEFAQELFGQRQRQNSQTIFPFTEPSAEVDVSASRSAAAKDAVSARVPAGSRSRCHCGIIHPNVLRMCGIDPDEYTGFAFGVGLERIALQI